MSVTETAGGAGNRIVTAGQMPERADADRELAGRIHHALIGRAITAERVRTHVADALRYGFRGIVLPGCWVPLAREVMAASGNNAAGDDRAGASPSPAAGGTSSPGLALGGILDFPYGSAATATRQAGAAALVEAGAEQIHSTVNVGMLLSGRQTDFAADLAAVVRAAAPAPVTFMLELPLLDGGQRARVVEAAVAAGARGVANATRGAVGIADAAQVAYLRARVPESMTVVATGGVRTVQQVRELLHAGADLVGSSAGVAIVTGRGDATGSVYSY